MNEWEKDEVLMNSCRRTIKRLSSDAKELFHLQEIDSRTQSLKDMVLFAKKVHGICANAMQNTYGENKNAVRHLMIDAELFYENLEVS